MPKYAAICARLCRRLAIGHMREHLALEEPIPRDEAESARQTLKRKLDPSDPAELDQLLRALAHNRDRPADQVLAFA